MWYDQEERKFWNGPYKEDPDCFYWVGDKLEIQWPNTIQDYIMNKHIKLVKKWLKDKDSVSLEELEANKKSAYDAYAAVTIAANAAYVAAHDAATYWVKRYEELTNE